MNKTLPELDMEARRKIGKDQGGVPKSGRAPVRKEKENDYEEVDETADEKEMSYNDFLKYKEWVKRRSTPKKGIRRPSKTDSSDYTDHYSDISDTPRPGTMITGKGRGSPASGERGWGLGIEFEPLLQPSFIQPLTKQYRT